MTRLLLPLAMAGLFVAGSDVAWGQEHDWNRARHVIERTQRDLRGIEHHDVWTLPERGHYEAAERNLGDVRRDLDENRLDRRRLDAAIGEMEHVSQTAALDPRARDRLNEDIHELNRLRDDWHWR